MEREIEDPVEVESDEEDSDDTIEVNDKCLEKPTLIELRSAIATLMDFNFLMESGKVQSYTMKTSTMIENELSKNLNQASVKYYFP